MKTINLKNAPRYKRDDIQSFLLVSAKTTGSAKMTVTYVEMEIGGVQHVHHHDPEQMYYIIEGEGLISVDGEEKAVKQGDCIFFPSHAKHGLKNTGETKLKYLSAGSPSFSEKQCEELWPLKSLSELTNDDDDTMFL